MTKETILNYLTSTNDLYKEWQILSFNNFKNYLIIDEIDFTKNYLRNIPIKPVHKFILMKYEPYYENNFKQQKLLNLHKAVIATFKDNHVYCIYTDHVYLKDAKDMNLQIDTNHSYQFLPDFINYFLNYIFVKDLKLSKDLTLTTTQQKNPRVYLFKDHYLTKKWQQQILKRMCFSLNRRFRVWPRNAINEWFYNLRKNNPWSINKSPMTSFISTLNGFDKLFVSYLKMYDLHPPFIEFSANKVYIDYFWPSDDVLKAQWENDEYLPLDLEPLFKRLKLDLTNKSLY